jgi:NAD(P)H-hydrate epimerase
MTRGRQTTEFMRNLLRECSVPLLVDADGIATFTSQPHWFEKAHCPMVITPHPGELSTLFGQDLQDILANRVGICEAASKFMECSVVLKGANTVVADPAHATHINLSGNPGMATGGSGDVLGGLIAALMGRGVDPFDAARIGVYVHGRAGDRVAWRKSQAGLSAMDLVEEIPYALREIIGR